MIRVAGAVVAAVGLRTGNATVSTANQLGWVAGRPTASTTMDLDLWTYGRLGTGGIRRPLCRAASARVPLSPTGLRGGGAPALGSKFSCEAPARVLVRLRAQLTAHAVPRGPELSSAHRPARSAQAAMRTTTGGPLAHGDVHESGKARLIVARGCWPK